MKNIKYLLLAITVLSFAACENGTSDNGSSPKTNQGTYTMTGEEGSYSIPSDVETIDFPTSANGKKCFVIYSNDTSADISLTGNTVSFNENDVERRSVKNTQPEITISKNVVRFSNGFTRDEVHFKVPEELKNYTPVSNSRSARAATSYGTYRSLDNNKFFARLSNNADYEKTFVKKAEGEHCRIWYYRDTTKTYINIDDSIFTSLKNTIDMIFEKETQIFGSNIFSANGMITANSSTKLDVLIYDLFGDATQNLQSGTFGFFNSFDFYMNEYLNDYNTYKYSIDSSFKKYALTSNECQAIHIDSYFLWKDVENNTEMVTSTLIHEFQHLLNFCNKGIQSYSDWFTEMLSMSAEDVFQSQINLSDTDSPKGRLNGEFGYPYKGFGYWPGNTDSDVYYAYANAYAFGAYLMRNYGGIRLIHEIATNSYVNKNAITRALQTLGYNETFESVLKKFGMVYVNTNSGDSDSLNRSISENYNGTTYTLDAINLNEYFVTRYNNRTACVNDLNNLYSETNQFTYRNAQGTSYWYLQKPRIFKSSYTLTEPIKSYGFAVFYLGTVQSGKSIKVPKNSNLGRTIVLK